MFTEVFASLEVIEVNEVNDTSKMMQKKNDDDADYLEEK